MNASEAKSIQTTCAYCGVGCGIQATPNPDGESAKISGLKVHPANHGKLCSKGTALGDTLQSKGRLLYPEVNGERASWDQVTSLIAQQFEQIKRVHGPDALAFYLSGQLLTEDYYVANKLMKGFIGSGNVDTNSRLCMSSSVAGHKRAFGSDTVPGCYEDFEQADLITLVGSNTAWCHPVLFQRIKRYKAQNPQVRVVVIDPRVTPTCEIADLHLPIRLGGDTMLFNGLLCALAEQGKIDHDFVKNHCEGLEDALEAARTSSGDLHALASDLEVDISLLTQFYDWFCQTEKSVTLYSQGVNQSSFGTDKVNSLLNCHLATARIGKPGMGPFSMTGQPNAMGGREVGGLANTLAAHMDFDPDSIDRVGRFWGSTSMADKPGKMAVDLFESILKGDIQAVWIMATNPVVSLPNADLVKAALEKCPLVIVSDCVEDTDTLRFAHIKLPATGWGEKDGTVTNSERCISRQRALFPPSGEARHDWWAISEVAKKMGFQDAFDYQSQADIFREHAELSGFENNDSATGRLRDFDISGLSQLSDHEYEALTPSYWPINAEHPEGRRRLFADGLFYTPTRRARLLPITPRQPVNRPSEDFPLRLNTGRIRDQWHTMTRTALAPQLNRHISEPYLEMHPDSAHKFALKPGQLVKVESQWGKMIARLNVNENCRRQDVFAPMHWNDVLSSCSRINAVVNPEVDPFSKQPESKHTPVKVSGMKASHYGFILSRDTKTWPDSADYAVTIPGQHQTLIQCAWESSQLNAREILEELISAEHVSEQQVVMRYDDDVAGIHRLAVLDKRDKLLAVAFVSTNSDLPETTWLASQFDQQSLNERSRMALLSGFAPAGEDTGKVVCACFNVGEKTLEAAVRSGCRTTKMLGEKLKAGTNCGSCLPELQQIIDAQPEKEIPLKVLPEQV